MKTTLLSAALVGLGIGLLPLDRAPLRAEQAAQGAAGPRPIRIYIRSGLKTHAAGEHDYPQFLADWSTILTARGAVVDGGLHFPSADDLAGVDVMVIYKGDTGTMTAREKAVLETFLKRGGGLVSLHDALCGDDPAFYATVLGGAKKHGERNFSEGPVRYTVTDPAHPIMGGMSDFEIADEAFFRITWAESPGVHVLATAPMPEGGEVVPQIWTYERTMFGGQPFRSFVWMQGHQYANFSDARLQPMLLRGIAWAARAPVDALSTVRAPRGGGAGGRGGRGRGAAQ